MVFSLRLAGRCLLGAFLLYLSSRLRLWTGGPVPVTGQTFCLALMCLLADTKTAVGASVLYLAAGAAGLDVFAGGRGLHSAGAGYLTAFPFAAFLMSNLSRKARQTLAGLTVSLLPGLTLIYLCGTAGLMASEGVRTGAVWGAAPFVCWDMVKLIFAALLALRARSGREDTDE
ncbi:MAG: biotin transporter BioY [Abditibacteriota bacterium]|nr:biotin transporter BioY [Abditibacteriota bacterium]